MALGTSDGVSRWCSRPSRNHAIPESSHATAYSWKSSDRSTPASIVPPMPPASPLKPGPVHRPVAAPGVRADVLHHIDLSAGRPAHLVDVGAQHPERRPGAAAAGDLEAAPPPPPYVVGEAVSRREPGRGDGGPSGFPPRRHREVPGAVEGRVGRAPRGELSLSVAQAATAELVCPDLRVGRLTLPVPSKSWTHMGSVWRSNPVNPKLVPCWYVDPDRRTAAG